MRCPRAQRSRRYGPAIERDPYRWTVLGAGTAAQASFAAWAIGLPVLAPGLRTTYHLTLTQIGVLLAATAAGGVLTVYLWGVAADRFGERITLFTGLAACGGCVVGMAYVHRFGALLVLDLLAGATGASVNAASGRAVMHWFPADERGFALGLRQTALPLGGLAAALGLPIVERANGVDGSLLGLGALCVLAAVVGGVLVRERVVEGEAPAHATRPMFRDTRLLRLGLASGFYVAAQITMIGFVVLFLHDARRLSTAAAAVVLAGMYLLGAASRIVVGRLSDRNGKRVAPLRHVGLTTFAAIAFAAALTHAPLGLLVPVLVAAGGLSMAWNGLSFTAAVELAGHRRSGAAIGVQQTFMAVSAVVFPIAFAATVAATSWWLGFAAAAGIALAGWWLLAPLSDQAAVA